MDLYRTSYGTNTTIMISLRIYIPVQILGVLYQHYLMTCTIAFEVSIVEMEKLRHGKIFLKAIL